MSKVLGIALAGGVAVWAAHLLLSYLLADLGCRGETALLAAGRHVLTLVAIVAVIAVTMPVRMYLARPAVAVRGAGVATNTTQSGSTRLLERPFLARVALFLNVMFMFAIVLAGAMNLFLAPCA